MTRVERFWTLLALWILGLLFAVAPVAGALLFFAWLGRALQ